MVLRGRGRVLNLSSTAAFQPGPLMAVYYASKAYVLSLSQALAEELRGTEVTVTALCPGPTRTGFQARGGVEDMRLVQHGLADVESVARIGWAGAMAGKPVVIPGVLNRVMAQGARLGPRGVTTRVVRKLHEPAR
jgi:short-subunit dehydrogenase